MSAVLLEEVKAHILVTDGSKNALVQSFIDEAEAIIVKKLGFLGPTTITGRRVSGGDCLVLPHAPVASVSSIVGKSGAVVSVAGTYLNQGAGLIEADTSFSEAWYTVTYVAGYATLPDHLALAVKELVKHLWMSQRGPTTRQGEDPATPITAHLLPYRVQSLLDLEAPLGFA